ncbi:MAG: hypothetical protein K8T10_07065 [Candidatus Eremiobacteraeota bacterium]|nr:hypothetical protein [Candidatus Eremiobacteraeota bacterium]
MEKGYHYDNVGEVQPRLPGVATRTPIDFGNILSKKVKKQISGFKRILAHSAENYLIHIFRKWLGKGWWGYALFQGAKRHGKFTVEVGISRRKTYPYCWASAKPDYSVDSVRERLGMIHFMEDKWWNYTSVNELKDILDDILTNFVGSGIHILMEQKRESLIEKFEEYHRQVRSIRRRIEGHDKLDPSLIFPSSPDIGKIHEFILKHSNIKSYYRLYDKEFQYRMGAPRFIVIQSRLMSDIINRPDIRYLVLTERKSLNYKDDIIYDVLGKIPREKYMRPTENEDERIMMYGYFKSLSVLESVIGFEAEEKDDKIHEERFEGPLALPEEKIEKEKKE